MNPDRHSDPPPPATPMAGRPISPEQRKRSAELIGSVLGLPAGERLFAVAHLLEALAEEDRTVRIDATALEQARRDLTEARDARAWLDTQVQEARSEYQRLGTQLEAEQKATASLRETSAAHRSQLDAAQKRLGERDATIAQQRLELDKLRGEIEQLRRAPPAAVAECQRCAELQRRAIELQQQLSRQQTDAAAQATARETDIQSLREQLAARGDGTAASGGRVAAGNGSGGRGVPPWLWERIRTARLDPVLPSEAPDEEVVGQIMDVYDALADGLLNVNEYLCNLLQQREEDLPRFREQCRAFFSQPLRDVIRACMSPESGSVRVVQRRLGSLQAWLNAFLYGTDAAIEQQHVTKVLRDFLQTTDKGWNKSTTIQKFLGELDGPDKFAKELARRRVEKVADAFEKEKQRRGG